VVSHHFPSFPVLHRNNNARRYAAGISRSANCDTERGGAGEVAAMRFLLGFIFGAFYTGTVRSGSPSCSSWSSVSTRCLNLLATKGESLRLQRRPAESDYCALMPAPPHQLLPGHRGSREDGGMYAMLESIRVNLPSPEKYRMAYRSCSGSRRAISSLHLSSK
jgi:hypothetical protein